MKCEKHPSEDKDPGFPCHVCYADLIHSLRIENAQLRHNLDKAICWLRTLVDKVGEVKKLKELES